MIDPHHGWNVSFKPQLLGFVLSLILIFSAFRMVTHYHLTHWSLVVAVFCTAITQALVQLVFFLHLGLEEKPRWNMGTFLFMLLVVFVIVGGSIWIMKNLNYNLMSM